MIMNKENGYYEITIRRANHQNEAVFDTNHANVKLHHDDYFFDLGHI